MREATVGHVGKYAIVEGEQHTVGAFRGACRIPASSSGPHALDVPATEQAHNIDLMSSLAEHHPTPLRRV